MPKPSITEYEISIIKAMLERGMRNKDIQFFFNRPKRPVNSGRITGIKNGTYSSSKTITPATEQTLNDFFSESRNDSNIGAVLVPSEKTMALIDHTAESEIKKLFKYNDDGYWELTRGETDCCEGKRNFGFKYSEPWLRAIAALANNVGGYVFFGVCDKGTKGPRGEDHSHYVYGMDDNVFLDADAANFSMRVRSFFEPTPRFEITTISFDNKAVGVIYVHKHPSAPVIATKQGKSKIAEGDIFYRYPGQSSRIKYGDLRAILDDRDKRARLESLPLIEKILEIGPNKSMVADLENGLLADPNNKILIDDDTIKKLKFVKEGQFVEKDGALTLKLIGDMSPIKIVETEKIKHDILTAADILDDFCKRATPDDPEQYIRWIVEASQATWLPIYYYANLAELNSVQLLDYVNNMSASPNRIAQIIKRLEKDATKQSEGDHSRKYSPLIISGEIEMPKSATTAGRIGKAFATMDRETELNLDFAFKLLQTSLALVRSSKKGMHRSYLNRGICRLDEILYSK